MNTKRFLSILLTLVMLLVCLPGMACAADEAERETFKSGDYTYALLDDGTVEITRYSGKANILSIPNELNWKKVTAIGDSAFYSCKSLTSVSIPDSVTSIGINPFINCSSLQSISISPDQPNYAVIDGVLFRKADKALIAYPAGKRGSSYAIPQGIASIGDRAFSFCDSLTSVSIPDSVTSIGDRAFSFCDSLTSVSIPDSVTSIGDWAFSFCESLTSVSIPDSVTSIGDRAFYRCSSLTSVSIPDSVTSIGNSAFAWCSSSLTLTVPRNSYAADYAKEHNLSYTYPDANDWLNN